MFVHLRISSVAIVAITFVQNEKNNKNPVFACRDVCEQNDVAYIPIIVRIFDVLVTLNFYRLTLLND